MKQQLTRRMRRPLAILIAAVIIAAFAPFILNFTNSNEEEGQIDAPGGTWYYDSVGIDSNGVQVGNKVTSFDDGVVSVSKTITDTVNGVRLDENEFLITLEVKTKVDVESLEINPDVAVVLTIDISGSMTYDKNGQIPDDPADRRMNIAKAAANDFIDSFAASSNGAARYVSVVVFGLTARVIQPWIDVGSAQGVTTATSNINTVKGQINKIRDTTTMVSGYYELENGTFMQGGLLYARNLYANESIGASVENRYVILLTDGNPNCWTNANNVGYGDPGTAALPQTSGERVDESMTGWRNARPYVTQVAKQIKYGTDYTKSARIYTIAYNTTGDDITGAASTSYGGYTYNNNGTAVRWFEECVAYNSSYALTATSNLNWAFDTISTNITRWAQAWTVTDPMGQHMVYKGTATSAPGQNPTFANNSLVWDLKQYGTVPRDTTTGLYTYTYSYRVTLDTLDTGFTAGQVYDTNGRTTLTYVMNEASGSNDPVELGKLITADFPIPSVHGFAADTFTFTKTGQYTGATLAGYEFALKVGDRIIQTARSNSSGVVTFRNIPSGHEYTLTERASSNPYSVLYDTSSAVSRIRVAWGDLTVLSEGNFTYDDDGTRYFVNPARDIPVVLQKFFSNADLGLFAAPTLICAITPHAHSDECYSEEPSCGLEEGDGYAAAVDEVPGHIHDEECYDDDMEVICGFEEGDGYVPASAEIPGHVHDFMCFSLECDIPVHAHDDECYDSNLRDEYTFKFVIEDRTGSWSRENSFTMKREDIIALIDPVSGAPTAYHQIDNLFTIPDYKINDGPFTITELNTGLGWTATVTGQSDVINIENLRQGPVVAIFNNGFGLARTPWFSITKDLAATRDGSTETFNFELRNEQGTVIRTIPVTAANGYRAFVYLDEAEFINANRVLTLKEAVGSTVGMSYDATEYTIRITNGEVVSINNVVTSNITFRNEYFSTHYPRFTIIKGTNENYNGTFTFEYTWDGTVWDGAYESSRRSVSGKSTTTINTTNSRESLVNLTDLMNFTGYIEIYEIGSRENWTYDTKHVLMYFRDGDWYGQYDVIGGTELSSGNEGNTASFYNSYSYTPPPPPDVPPPDEPPPSGGYTGNIRVTKEFLGIANANIPSAWGATITVTGTGSNSSYSQSRTISASNRSVTFSGLNPGSYIVSEVGPGNISNYTLVNIAGEGTYTVSANNTTNVTITNTYETTTPPPTSRPPVISTPPPGGGVTIEEEGPPLSEFPPDNDGPGEDIEIPYIPVPLGDMPETGIQDWMIVGWFYGVCASMIAIGLILRAITNVKRSIRREHNEYKH